MALIPTIHTFDDVRRVLQKLAGNKLGPNASPTFAGLTLTGLTASRLIWCDSNKALASKDLVDLVTGVANEIDITDNSGGIIIGIVNPLIVAKGGIGIATLTDHGILLGSGTGAVTPLAAASNGQIPIGSAGADPVLATITGTANRITVSNAAGSITLTGPQDIHTGASPTFAGLHINSAEVSSVTLLTLESDINNADEYNEILFKIAGGVNYGAIRSCVGAANNSYMSFLTTTDGGTLVPQVTIQHDGKTGYGTESPSQKLDIIAGNSGVLISDTGEGRGVAKSLFFGDGGGTWTPIIWGVGGATGENKDAGLHLLAETKDTDDSGAEPLIRLNARQTDNTSITTRPILTIENNRNQLVIVDKNGNVDITGTITSTSFGGIASANLLDKSAAETITGIYTHTAILKVQSNVVADGYLTMLLGADVNANTLTDNTRKSCQLGMPHYDIDEQAIALFYGDSSAATNYLNFGGGSGAMNAVTHIRFFTAANTTTITGTERMSIDSSGNVNVVNNITVDGTVDGIDIATDVAANTTHRGLTSGNPHVVTPTELSLVIGTNVQAYDAGLTSIAGLTTAVTVFLQATATDTYQFRTMSQTKSDLGLGGADTAVFANLTIANPGVISDGTKSATVAQLVAAYDHSQDNSQAHSDYLINDGDDATSGALTVGSLITGGDIGIAADTNLIQLAANAVIINGTLAIYRDVDWFGVNIGESAAKYAGFYWRNALERLEIATNAYDYGILINDSLWIETDTNSGRVGINDMAPAEMLDVNGNINVTGVLKVDDVQVVSNQQVHIADAPGDTAANNAITINAILVALETHGLLAAA